MERKSNFKKFIYLTNFELSFSLKKVLSAVALFMFIQLIMFVTIVSNEENSNLRFEELADMSGYEISFAIAAFVVLGIIAFCFYKNWLGGKSIYSLLCLPTKRLFVYFSKLTAALISVSILVTAQLTNVLISYGIYNLAFPDVPKLRNGLLLAFLRWDFLSMFFPQDTKAVLGSIAYILTSVVAVLFLIILERSGQIRKAVLFVAISVGVILLPLPFGSGLKCILIAFLLGVYSLKLINEGSIT